MVAQPDRDLPARREEALARLAATTDALAGLDERLRAEPDLPDATAQALLAGARALCPVAAGAGGELAVSAGPDHAWAVHVEGDADGPTLRLARRHAAPSPDVAGELAALLRTGGMR